MVVFFDVVLILLELVCEVEHVKCGRQLRLPGTTFQLSANSVIVVLFV